KKEFEHSYTFGVFPTLELIEHRRSAAVKVLVSEAGLKNKGVAKLEELCERHTIPFEVNSKAVERLAPRENSFAIGVFRKYAGKLDPKSDHVLLVNPSDMGNLGTIIRTMLGFNVTNLGIIRPAADIFDPRVARASMGALFSLNHEYFDNYEAYSATYAAPPRALYPFMTNGNQPLSNTHFSHPNTLIFGNESSGLPDSYRTIGHTITISHGNKIDSLNLTIAVALGLYEANKK
ncbi:MAG: TrmH family RNA methyltransferase, partial [Chloroflexia bacterium]